MARFASVSLIALAWGMAAAPVLAQDAGEVWVEPQAAALGDTVTGELVEGDSRTEEDGLMDRYVLDLQAGTPIDVVMRSEEFDTYLVAGFVGPNGWEEIGRDDDGLGEGLNSRLRFLASKTGRYEIRARGFFGGGDGPYSLSFTQGEPMAARATPSGSLVAGGSARGALQPSDAAASEMDGGYRYDAYRLRASAGDRLAIIARSDAFDPVVYIGSGSRWGLFTMLGYDDDGLGEGFNSRLLFTAPSDGDYEIRVASFGDAGEGDYTVSVEERAPLPTPVDVTYGQAIQGRLDASDGEGDDALRYDAYRVTLTAGQRIEAVADSTAFDTNLDLGTITDGAFTQLRWDDGYDGSNTSRLLFTAEADGEYVFRLGSYEADATGPYTLTVTDRGPLPPPPPPGAIAVGDEVSGALADGDGVTAEERYFDDYVVRANPNQRLSITLRSPTFDTLVEIGRYNETGALEVITSDDDGLGEGLNSRALFIPDAVGEYVVRVTSFGMGETGDYTLSLRDLGPEPAPQTLRIGRTVSGELSDADGIAENGVTYDPFTFRLAENERIEFIGRSADFDVVLGVARNTPSGREFIAVDDDGLGEGTDSRLVFTAPETGNWELWVTAYDETGRGRYTLSSEALGPAPEPQPIRLDRPVQGELNTRDAMSTDGTYYDAFSFSGEAGRRVRFEMRSDAFDTFLLLGREIDGQLTAIGQDDDGLGEGTNSRLTFTLPVTGDYEIWASSYGTGETGAYSLTYQDLGPAPQPGSVVVGSTARGTLDAEDATDEYGSFYEAYRIRLAADEAIRIELTSNAFDTLVQIGRTADGAFVQDAMDDDGLSDTNSRLDFTTPEAGEYVIRVRSYAPGEAGDYAMTVEPAPGA